MTAVCMIYGATGFIGRLILEAALARGLRPIVAGRSEPAVQALAERHQLPFRVFSISGPEPMPAEVLEDVDVVLNAAGPVPAAESLAQACIQQGVHYLDIGCDLRRLRKLAARDEAARAAGVGMVCGMGFSPAVAEALAVHLKRRLPGAVRLVIGLSTAVRAAPGLLRSGLDIALLPSAALRRGRVKTMRRRRLRRIDFGCGPEPCYGLGWGELAAVHRATGVRNVDFFVRARPDLLRLLRLSPLIAACRRLPILRQRFEAFVTARGLRPDAQARPARSHLTGYAYDPAGQRAVSRIHLPDPYTVTAELAAEALVRASTAPPRPGVHTAGQYLGAEFLAQIPGLPVDWEELELSAPGEVNLRIRRRGRFPFLWRFRSPRPEVERHAPPHEADRPGIPHLAAPGTGTETGAAAQDDHDASATPEKNNDEAQEARSGGDSEGLRRTGTD